MAQLRRRSPIRGGASIKDHAFDKQDLDDFLTQLLVGVPAATADDPNLVQIPLAARRARCSAIDIVHMIFAGKLSRLRRRKDVHGYLSILVDVEEIGAAIAPAPREGLSIAQVEERTGWSRPVVTALIKNEWLKSRIVRNPISRNNQSVVEPEDLEDFCSKYVSLSSLARERGQFIGSTKITLASAGIEPVFAPEHSKAAFYRRRDLPPP